MIKILSLFGLGPKPHLEQEPVPKDQALRAMTVSRDDWRTRSTDWEAKFKKAVTDLEKQAVEIARLRFDKSKLSAANSSLTADAAARNVLITGQQEEIENLTPDALLWRNARDKRAGKKGKANG